MTGFLASVKNIDEAKKICLSNADIIDFKKVNDGALGFVGSNIIRQGRKVLQDRIISVTMGNDCLLYTSPSPRDRTRSRMPSSA